MQNSAFENPERNVGFLLFLVYPPNSKRDLSFIHPVRMWSFPLIRALSWIPLEFFFLFVVFF